MNLTVEERKHIYEVAISRIDSGTTCPAEGLCSLILNIVHFDVIFTIADDFPELQAQMPDNEYTRCCSGYWFKPDRWKERRECLVNALKLIS